MLAVQEEEEAGSNVNCWMDIRSGQYPEVHKLLLHCNVCHCETFIYILYDVCNVCDV